MNRKMSLLIVAVVAAILPAVAVADVLITGQVGITGTTNNSVFHFEIGPNFYQADDYIQFTANPEGQTMAHMGFDMAYNQTVLAINVLEIVFSAGASPGIFYLNLTGLSTATYPDGSYMYVSTSLMNFSDFLAPNSYASPGSPVVPIVLHVPSGNTVTSGPINVTGGSVLYIGFYLLGAGPSPETAELLVDGTYITS